jgi:hypothetical protein
VPNIIGPLQKYVNGVIVMPDMLDEVIYVSKVINCKNGRINYSSYS